MVIVEGGYILWASEGKMPYFMVTYNFRALDLMQMLAFSTMFLK